MLRFTFKEPPRILRARDADPQAIGEVLTAHVRAHGGNLDIAVLHDDEIAPNKRHPCYRHLEWDDKIAGRAYRLNQLGAIIRILRSVDDDETSAIPQRAFLSIHDDDGRAYRSVEEIRNDPSLQVRLLQEAVRELGAFQQRFSELFQLCEQIGEMRGRLLVQIETMQRERMEKAAHPPPKPKPARPRAKQKEERRAI